MSCARPTSRRHSACSTFSAGRAGSSCAYFQVSAVAPAAEREVQLPVSECAGCRRDSRCRAGLGQHCVPEPVGGADQNEIGAQAHRAVDDGGKLGESRSGDEWCCGMDSAEIGEEVLARPATSCARAHIRRPPRGSSPSSSRAPNPGPWPRATRTRPGHCRQCRRSRIPPASTRGRRSRK